MFNLTRRNLVFIFCLIAFLFLLIVFHIDVNIIVAVIALFTLVWAIASSNEQIKKLSEELQLLEKHVFGNVYETAQIKDLEFAMLYHKKQKQPGMLLKEITLNIKKDKEIGVHWKMAARQGLRKIAAGFGGEIDKKPIIMDTCSRFVTKRKASFLRDEHQDCWGWWHVEYAHSRIVPDNEDFEIAYKIKMQKPGNYNLNIHIFTDEAREPFKGILKVKII